MSDITSSSKKIQIEGARARGAVSESLIQTIGGSLNYCLDQIPLKQNISTLNRLKFQSTVSGSGTVTNTTAQTVFTASYYSIVTIAIWKTGGNGGGRIYLDDAVVYDGTLDIPASFTKHSFTVFMNAGQALKVARGTYWQEVQTTIYSGYQSATYTVLGYNGSLMNPDGVAYSITGIQFDNHTGN